MPLYGPLERIDSFEALLKAVDTKSLKVGNVSLERSDFKCYALRIWMSSDAREKRLNVYKQIQTKFLIVVRSVRRYIRYHRQCQFLINFINSKGSNSKKAQLDGNKLEILKVMKEYLQNFIIVQQVMGVVEKLLRFLVDSSWSLRTNKFQEVMQELYKVEKLMQSFCFRISSLLRNSDDMIDQDLSGSQCSEEEDEKFRKRYRNSHTFDFDEDLAKIRGD